jgi:hypothetical protein
MKEQQGNFDSEKWLSSVKSRHTLTLEHLLIWYTFMDDEDLKAADSVQNENFLACLERDFDEEMDDQGIIEFLLSSTEVFSFDPVILTRVVRIMKASEESEDYFNLNSFLIEKSYGKVIA